jgi:hypothetical protein
MPQHQISVELLSCEFLPEGVVVVNKGDKVAPDFAAVEGAFTLILKTVEKTLWTCEASDQFAQRSIASIALGGNCF